MMSCRKNYVILAIQWRGSWNACVDDVIPTAVPVLLDHQLQLQGLMIWSQKGTSKEWVEPCSMRVSKNVDVSNYEILCGDAFRGLREVTYEQRRKAMNGALPEQWKFVFLRRPSIARCPMRVIAGDSTTTTRMNVKELRPKCVIVFL